MSAGWFYRSSANEELGPLSPAELVRLASEGSITASTMVRKGTEGRWVLATQVKGLINGERVTAKVSDSETAVRSTTSSPNTRESKTDKAAKSETHLPPKVHDPEKKSKKMANAEVIATLRAIRNKRRMTRALIGVGISSLVLGLVVLLVSPPSLLNSDRNSETPNLPTFGPTANGQERLASETTARSAKEIELSQDRRDLEEAKKVLLDDLKSVGGTPASNVQRGIELLTAYLSRPDAPNQVEAKLLLEHAQIAISDEKAVEFVQMLSDAQRSELVGHVDVLSGDDLIIVKQSQIDALSRGFSERFNTKVDGDGIEEPTIFVCGRAYQGGGEYCNSIETAFYESVETNAKHEIERIVKERKAGREMNPKGTAPIFEIEESPLAFSGDCVYFNEFVMNGSTYKKGDDDYRLSVTDTRGKRYSSVGFRDKEIIFSTSMNIARQIQQATREDTSYVVKLYCDMYVTPLGGPLAFVYKIDFYNRGGGIFVTVSD